MATAMLSMPRSGTLEYHGALYATHIAMGRLMPAWRNMSLPVFAKIMGPYIVPDEAPRTFASFAVHLNPNSSAGSRVSVNVTDANWYRTLCHRLQVNDLMYAGRSIEDRSFSELATMQPIRPVSGKAGALAGRHTGAPCDPFRVPDACRPGLFKRAQQHAERLLADVATQVATRIHSADSFAKVKAYLRSDDLCHTVRDAVDTAQSPPLDVCRSIATTVQAAVASNVAYVRQIKSLQKRSEVAAQQAVIGSRASSSGREHSAFSDGLSDDEDEAGEQLQQKEGINSSIGALSKGALSHAEQEVLLNAPDEIQRRLHTHVDRSRSHEARGVLTTWLLKQKTADMSLVSSLSSSSSAADRTVASRVVAEAPEPPGLTEDDVDDDEYGMMSERPPMPGLIFARHVGSSTDATTSATESDSSDAPELVYDSGEDDAMPQCVEVNIASRSVGQRATGSAGAAAAAPLPELVPIRAPLSDSQMRTVRSSADLNYDPTVPALVTDNADAIGQTCSLHTPSSGSGRTQVVVLDKTGDVRKDVTQEQEQEDYSGMPGLVAEDEDDYYDGADNRDDDDAEEMSVAPGMFARDSTPDAMPGTGDAPKSCPVDIPADTSPSSVTTTTTSARVGHQIRRPVSEPIGAPVVTAASVPAPKPLSMMRVETRCGPALQLFRHVMKTHPNHRNVSDIASGKTVYVGLQAHGSFSQDDFLRLKNMNDTGRGIRMQFDRYVRSKCPSTLGEMAHVSHSEFGDACHFYIATE